MDESMYVYLLLAGIHIKELFKIRSPVYGKLVGGYGFRIDHDHAQRIISVAYYGPYDGYDDKDRDYSADNMPFVVVHKIVELIFKGFILYLFPSCFFFFTQYRHQ